MLLIFEIVFSAPVILWIEFTSRGVGSKFGLVRQILCQSSQHSVQLQTTLHAKHANARGIWWHAPQENYEN